MIYLVLKENQINYLDWLYFVDRLFCSVLIFYFPGICKHFKHIEVTSYFHIFLSI
jgi:hypothetical protein